jgi:hypothetical protein
MTGRGDADLPAPGSSSGGADPVTRRCAVCGRFRSYEPEDGFCIVCGHDHLESACGCGRGYGYALAENGDVHCPRCGRVLRGQPGGYE